ncbi:MAG: 23S rRNA (guanosine(2251)-2'-O)-methyltransferase RlmB [Endomicrobia bacterium]|nr:23S rRNA (guanosine(2251)-2'-O)-methyltransferase RlmB [Endomicrobiia bacterium]
MTTESFITSKTLIKEIIKTRPDLVSKLYIANNAYGKDIEEIIALAKKKKVSFLTVPKEKILSIFNQGYSGLVLVVSPVRYYSLEELLSKISQNSEVTLLILDEINDPHNFGAILRTAAAFNIDGVIIQQWNQVPVTQTVVETSRGGVFNIPIVKVKNVFNAITVLKKNDFWIYSALPPESAHNNIQTVNVDDIKSQKRLAIVLGNEHKGVRKNIISNSDAAVIIQQSNKVQSLNVSVCCGIILYEIYKCKSSKYQ